jgi:hypothetical protein
VSNEHISIICDELDAHAKDMIKTVARLETVAFGKTETKVVGELKALDGFATEAKAA